MSNPGFTEEVSNFIEKSFPAYIKLTSHILNQLDAAISKQN